MQIEDAERMLIRFIRERPATEYSSYGYDIYISNVIRWFVGTSGTTNRSEMEHKIHELSPVFYAAA